MVPRGMRRFVGTGEGQMDLSCLPREGEGEEEGPLIRSFPRGFVRNVSFVCYFRVWPSNHFIQTLRRSSLSLLLPSLLEIRCREVN